MRVCCHICNIVYEAASFLYTFLVVVISLISTGLQLSLTTVSESSKQLNKSFSYIYNSTCVAIQDQTCEMLLFWSLRCSQLVTQLNNFIVNSSVFTIDCCRSLLVWLKHIYIDLVNSSAKVLLQTADYLSFVITTLSETLSLEFYLFVTILFLVFLVVLFVVDQLQNRGLTFPRLHIELANSDETTDLVLADDSFSESDDEVLDSVDTSTSSSDTDSSTLESIMYMRLGEGEEYEIATDSETESDLDDGEQIEVILPSREHYTLRNRHSVTPSRSNHSARDLARRLENEREKHKCVVCQDDVKNVLVMPCKHMCLCVDCAHSIVEHRNSQRRVCPLCRGRISKVMNIFV